MPQPNYYAKLARTLARYEILMLEHKLNPVHLFLQDRTFRIWVYSKFDWNVGFTWFGNVLVWSDIAKSYPDVLHLVESENPEWITCKLIRVLLFQTY